ncbi:LUD domain-containing protein [Nocardia farcinica]|uniref:LUD domain-containing protein n=1 Tax=Nocardia farcinica TaxID=37329 RepID=UPI0007620908|nr:LUD domain-containing protein [Nocardia farcinica]PEH75393.1 lactate utilization protein C [Nocardia sp. FDAARGOS_372]AXK85101.1 lactate utilization protein C [Nocardia farcinica]MBA4855512.1 LUD domain-containing protein [Nocardia farcinica]MBC9818149.1 LUD domain-containing protein [Nocardia farcinica]MBF6140343.1 LUD domain-containing protein [Nocardia farcinica]
MRTARTPEGGAVSSDEQLLRRVRDLLVELPDDERVVPVRRGRHAAIDPADRAGLVSDFLARLARDGARGRRVAEEEVAAALDDALRTLGATAVMVPDGLPAALLAPWRNAGHRVVTDSPMSAAEEFDGVDAVVTTCAAAVADSGALVLDGGPGQMRRAARLDVAWHVCLVRAEQIGPSLPEVVDRLDPRRSITMFGGPGQESAGGAGLVVLVVE